MNLDAETEANDPALLLSLVPLMFLIPLLGLAVYLFGDDASFGPAQIVLMLSGVAAGVIGMIGGQGWREIEKSAARSVADAVPAILILLAVGSLIGTWLLAGIIPALIYYGTALFAPEIFYLAALLVSAATSLVIGSSWTTAGTIGVAVIGIAGITGLSIEITAGAIISGAYFGDKLSPLSDTTNLAAATASVDLFRHIQFLMWSTLPAFAVAMIAFGGFSYFAEATASADEIALFRDMLDQKFTINSALLLPPIVVIVMAIRKMPPFPAILIGALLGGVFAILFQPDVVMAFVGGDGSPLMMVKGVWTALFAGFSATTGQPALDELLTGGGMANMLSTVWLIISAMFFGGMMEHTGCLRTILGALLRFATTSRSLLVSAGMTAFVANIVASDQYLAIVLPGRMYRIEFERRGLSGRNLSRLLEDYGTVTSPLVPWNTCGAFMAATLGVPTLMYLPFCVFNIASPLVSLLYAMTHFKIELLGDSTEPA